MMMQPQPMMQGPPMMMQPQPMMMQPQPMMMGMPPPMMMGVPQQAPQPTIIINEGSHNEPLPPVFPRAPIPVSCPICRKKVTTEVKSQCSSKQWLACVVISCIFWPAACVPFCMGDCYDNVHRCPQCQTTLGRNLA